MTQQQRFITSSEIGTYKQCPRKWWLKNHRGLRSRHPSMTGTMQLGSRVHEATEAFYTPGAEDGEADGYAAIRERAERESLEYPEQAEDIADEAEYARLIFEGYVEWLEETGADQNYEVVAVEQEVSTPVVYATERNAYRLLGKLDRQVERRFDGARMFLDDKVVGNLTDKPALAELDPQMKLYTLISRMNDGETKGGIYNQMRKVKRTGRARPPFYDRHEFQYNDTDLENFFQSLLGTIEQIEQAEARLEAGEQHQRVVPPNPSRDCTWSCPFFHSGLCSMLDDGSDSDYIIEHEYEVGDPLERYEELETL